MKISLIAVLLLCFGVALFAAQNAGPIAIRFLSWHGQSTLAMVVFGAAACGALAVLIAEIGPTLRSRRALQQLHAKVAELEMSAVARPESESPSPAQDAQHPGVS